MHARSLVEWDYLVRFMDRDGVFAQCVSRAAVESSKESRERSPLPVPYDHEFHIVTCT